MKVKERRVNGAMTYGLERQTSCERLTISILTYAKWT